MKRRALIRAHIHIAEFQKAEHFDIIEDHKILQSLPKDDRTTLNYISSSRVFPLSGFC